MARVSTYLNFERSTEDAFNFYRSVFGTQFSGPIMRFGDIPPQPGQPGTPEADKKLVMHIELPILAGHVLMGTDAPKSMGFTLTSGNTVTINLEPDSRAETDKLFAALGQGGQIDMPLQAMFWGGYFGILVDKYGIRWMFNCPSQAQAPIPEGSDYKPDPRSRTAKEIAWQIVCEEKMIMASSFLFDIVHHRGQISTYLRPMGSTVPQIYGPSGDEP